MTKQRSTKRALLLSALSLLMCVSMLIGSTFAWFTDSVTSAGNKIQAGTLDIDLFKVELKDDWMNHLATGEFFNKTEITDSSDPLFSEDILWEPGYTEVVSLELVNNGNLALKYQTVLRPTAEIGELAEVIDVYVNGAVFNPGSDNREDYIAAATKIGTLKDVLSGGAIVEGEMKKDGDDVQYFSIILKMQEEAGNKYQGKTAGAFDITVLATQLTYEEDSFDNQYDYAAGTAFVGGKGTAEAPYLINDASQLLSISDYDEYTYFKVADGVETLDMTGVGKIKLNGSFDGNGVTMNNLTTALFQSVGEVGNAQDIKISNFTANVHTADGSALVKNIFNPGTTTFENVTLHGYIEGQYNVGSFYNYGTANGDGVGADYTVSFVNTKSDATLVCTTGNAIGGMLGHGYQGADKVLSINMDTNSGYTGQMYTTDTAKCYGVMALCSTKTYMLNGVETNRQSDEYPSTKLTKATPTAGADGYYVAPATGVDHYVVYLNSQLTAYDANGVEITNQAGMTWNLGKETITSGFDGKIFDLITSAKIVNNAEDELGYAMNNGELTIYSGRDANYASGRVTLQVNQYDADGVLLATGITTVHTFAEP